MRAPKIPSFFKSSKARNFSFQPRYYDELKERHTKLNRQVKRDIKFKKTHTKQEEKGRNIRIVLLIIILSLLAYKFIIN